MSNHGRIGYVEIPVSDIERAAAFYEAIFGWRVNRDPENSPGYWTFAGPDDPQAGALERVADVTAHQGGPLVYVGVDDIPATLGLVAARGGRVERDRTEIGEGLGHYALIRDPDGNRFGLWAR